MGHRTSPSCADELTWQRLADGEMDPDRAELLWHHLSVCDACRASMAVVQASRRVVSELLGKEDDEADAAGAVRRVRQRLRPGDAAPPPIDAAIEANRGSEPTKPALWNWRPSLQSSWPRFATAAGLAAVAVLLLSMRSSDVGATPDFVLNKLRVSERAWRYQPGKVLRWISESDIKGHPTMPDGTYRTLWWQSNVEGNTGEILRKYDGDNRFVWGRWKKADGRVAYFSSRGLRGFGPNRLVIEPSDAAITAALPSLPSLEQDAVRRYLRERTESWSPQVQSAWFGEYLGDVAQGQKRNMTIERRTTPEWGIVYYVRGDRARDGTPWKLGSDVTRFVDEQYIGMNDYRLYRRKTTRYNERGEAAHVEDSRSRDFSETTLTEYQAQDLDFDGTLPADWTVVRQTPEQHAAMIAKWEKATRSTTAVPEESGTKKK